MKNRGIRAMRASTRRRRWRSAGALATLIVCAAFAVKATAQVYKCADVGGRTVYSDAPCAKAGSKLRLGDEAPRGAPASAACVQLLDETRRMAAEAGRDTSRGRAVNAVAAKRRQALLAQYRRRCVGISRSTN